MSSKTPEGRVKASVAQILALHKPHIYWFLPVGGGYGSSGVPDIIVAAYGKFLAIECKAGNNMPTALQEHNLSLIRNAHGTALIINEDNLDVLAVTLAAWRGEYERDNP
jgi:hypothetical protein